MSWQKWSYGILAILVILIGGYLFALFGIRFYLAQHLLPDLEHQFHVQIETDGVQLNPLRGIWFHDLRIRSLKQESVGHEIFIHSFFLWSPPWQWWQKEEIPFHYEIQGMQRIPLTIVGEGSWNPVQKILTLQPSLRGPLLPSFFSPLEVHLQAHFKTQECAVTAQTRSGVLLQFEGAQMGKKFMIRPSSIRFRDSYLKCMGNITSANETQLYLKGSGEWELEQIENLLQGKRELFSRIASRLSQIEFETSFQENHWVIEKFLAGYASGELSLLGDCHLAFPYPFRLSIKGEEIELSDLIKTGSNRDQPIEGTLNGSFSLQGEANSLNSLEGEGGFEINDGHFWDLTLLKGIANLLKLPELEKIIFESAKGRFLLKNNQLSFPQVELKSRQLRLEGIGTIDLGGKIDFNVTITFSQELIQQLGETLSGMIARFLINSQGEALIQIHIKGTVQNPTYKIKPIAPEKIFQGVLERILK